MSVDFDVFVIGGGPAGLATAIATAQRGLHVAVADAWGPGIDKACGEGLMPDSVKALGALGVTLPEDAGQPIAGIRFLGGDVAVDAHFPSGTGLGVRRTVLHDLLERGSRAPRSRAAMGDAGRWLTGRRFGGRPGRMREALLLVALDRGRRRRTVLRAQMGRSRRLPPRRTPLRFPPALSDRALERVHGAVLGRGRPAGSLPDLRHARGCAGGLRGRALAQSAVAAGPGFALVSAVGAAAERRCSRPARNAAGSPRRAS